MMHYLGHIPQSATVGEKTRGLERLMKLKYSVPHGFIFDVAETKKNDWKNRVDKAAARLSDSLYAVRSSAEGEDGRTCSLAGEFLTRTKVTRSRLFKAIEEVIAHAEKVAPGKKFTVIIQEWIEGDCSGIAFSRHPTRALGEVVVIDAVKGTAEALVSGRAKERRAFVWSDTALIPDNFPSDRRVIHELERAARALEDQFSHPVDLEWTVHSKTLYLLQVRPMTVVPEYAPDEEDEGRVMRQFAEDRELRLDRSAMAESLPHPSRASLDLVRYMFRRGGSFARAAAELGLTVNREGAERYFVPVMGHLYVDEREAPFGASAGLLKGLRTALKTSRAVKRFPFNFYRTPWKALTKPRDIDEALEMLDGEAGLDYARSTILARVAVKGPKSPELALKIWKLRETWLKGRPIMTPSQDFELTVKGELHKRTTWSQPKTMTDAYAILKEDAKDEIRPALAHIAALVKDADLPLGKAKFTEADRHLAHKWKELRNRAKTLHLSRMIEWEDLFDLRTAHAKKSKAKNTLQGAGVSAGIGEGRVVIGSKPGTVPAGSILVLGSLTPEWFPCLTKNVKGVVTETGSGLSHGAIQCRERKIPAVFGVDDAIIVLKDKSRIRLDGKSGELG